MAKTQEKPSSQQCYARYWASPGPAKLARYPRRCQLGICTAHGMDASESRLHYAANRWWTQALREPDPDTRLALGKKIPRAQAENLWMIGTVGMIPHLIIANNKRRNVSETGFWGWDSTYTMNRSPAQVFFAESLV